MVKLRDVLTTQEQQMHDRQIELAQLLCEPNPDDQEWFTAVAMCAVAMSTIVQQAQYSEVARAITANQKQYDFLKVIFTGIALPEFPISKTGAFTEVIGGERQGMVILTYALLALSAAKIGSLLPFFYSSQVTNRPVASKQALSSALQKGALQLSEYLRHPPVTKKFSPTSNIYHVLYPSYESPLAKLKKAVILGQEVNYDQLTVRDIQSLRQWLKQHGFPTTKILPPRFIEHQPIIANLRQVTDFTTAQEVLSEVTTKNHDHLRRLNLLTPISTVLEYIPALKIRKTKSLSTALPLIIETLLKEIVGSEQVAMISVPCRSLKSHLYHYIATNQLEAAISRLSALVSVQKI